MGHVRTAYRPLAGSAPSLIEVPWTLPTAGGKPTGCARSLTTQYAIEIGACWPGRSAGVDQQAVRRASTKSVLVCGREALRALRSETNPAMAACVSA